MSELILPNRLLLRTRNSVASSNLLFTLDSIRNITNDLGQGAELALLMFAKRMEIEAGSLSMLQEVANMLGANHVFGIQPDILYTIQATIQPCSIHTSPQRALMVNPLYRGRDENYITAEQGVLNSEFIFDACPQCIADKV